MGDLTEFNLAHRLFLTGYPWRRIDPVPWSPLAKPLTACRLALVSSAGFVPSGARPFDQRMRGGDYTFREISNDTNLSSLTEFHRSDAFDHSGIQADPNLALPLDRVRTWVGQGRIGSLNHRHLSFMGSITAPGRLIQETAPEAARGLASDGVDIALLVPV